MSDYIELSDALELLEDKMIELALWESQQPSEHDLASSEPFALDTLSPTQWLQWVFIPKMKALIESDSEMPTGFEISPYFEQAMSDKEKLLELLPIIKQIDEAVK
ncbi:pseudouridine synthase [Vibrio rumoiensis 1S-45]|uniref:Pseudouridine synthase n=2 Tax=Vibrio rumoiensis TaxID=76258 RepID=A0A1E5E1H4_9VIBR|nr:pseudouridine synthase [Vibrio rumoiensis 1S-45]